MLVDNNDLIKEPLLVKNPITGRFVNVAPFFNLASDDFDSIQDIAKKIDKSIQFLTCYKHEGMGFGDFEFPNLISGLFDIRNALQNMTEFKEDIS